MWGLKTKPPRGQDEAAKVRVTQKHLRKSTEFKKPKQYKSMQNMFCLRDHFVKWRFKSHIALFTGISLLAAFYSSGQNVTLSLQNAPIEKAFTEITRQTGYSFVYTRDQVQKASPVNLRLNNEDLKAALDLCFANQPLSYTIEDKHIIVQSIPPRKKEIPATTEATSQKLTGRILDEAGEPLAGAFVKIKESSLATISDSKGRFELTAIPEEAVLQVSYVGYFPQELLIGTTTYLEVHLVQNITHLDETVVIAYGTTTKRYNTGTVSKVTANEIATQPVTNPLAALQGRIAGLNIVETGGLPGSNFSVLIRGRNSIQNGTSPLFVIDGIPFFSDADRMTQFSQVNANSPFNTLNPADIESITVLKDADATSIYGSRGANGVILITTKKGKSGRTTVDINMYRGWGYADYNVDFLNTQQYVKLRREAFINDKAKPSNANAPDLLKWDTTRYTDWKKELIGGTADKSNLQVRLEGGISNTFFSLSANHYKETTVFPGDANMLKNTIGLTVSHKGKDNRLNIDVEASYASNKNHLYQQDLTQFINTIPNAPKPYDSLGNLNWSENGAAIRNHPMANILRIYDVITDRLTGNTVFSYRFGKLTLKSAFGYNAVSVDEHSIFPIASDNPSFNPTGSANFGNSSTKSWIIEPRAHYNLIIGANTSIEFMGGATWQESLSNNKQIQASGYTDDLLLNSTTGAASVTGTTYNGLLYRYQAIYGRLTTNHNRKYILNLTYRRDGSSRFGPGNQFANFASAGGAWLLSEERWMKKIKPVISFAKIRASFGINGNDQIGDYQFFDTWSPTTYPYGGISGLYPTRITNPYYGWERKQNIEVGLDLGFFTDALLISVNYFRSRSDNQIIRYTLPDQTGSNNILMNFPGVVENKGFEVEASARIFNKTSFSWATAFNMTIPRNKLVSFPGLSTSSYSNTYVEGQPLSVLRGFDFLGVNPETGIYRFRDINADGKYNNLDYITIGHTDAKFYGGLNNILGYQSVELQFFIQFVNQKGRDLIYGSSQRPGQQFNQPVEVENRWRQKGDVKPYQQSTQSPVNPAFSATSLLTTSSAILTDASFLRLKNLSLSYKLPHKGKLLSKFNLIRVFAEGQNILLITSYKGSNPESQGRLTLPPLKVFATGIQVKF